MNIVTKSNIISLVPAIVVAVVVYFALLILFKGVTEAELKAMPKGYLLVKVARKCKLLK